MENAAAEGGWAAPFSILQFLFSNFHWDFHFENWRIVVPCGSEDLSLRVSGTWAEPDYERVRERVQAICQPLKKADLLALNRQFTGRGASSDSKADLIQLIANPILTRLENRFMFLS